MCIATIIDANGFGSFLNDANSALRSWISRRDGFLVYSIEGDYAKEIQKSRRMMDVITAYRRNNAAKLISSEEIKAADVTLPDNIIRSNDRHVLALAKASNALVLFSDDRNLQHDFRNSRLLPKVGRRSRSVYPVEQPRSRQLRFLGRLRCRDR